MQEDELAATSATPEPLQLEPLADEALQSPEEVLAQELAEAKDKYLRTLAEVDNFKKRVARERVEERAYAAQDVVTSMLPIIDNLERTLAAAQASPAQENAALGQLLKGVELVAKQMEDALRKQGVMVVEASVGQIFDPNLHQPLLQEESADAVEGAILEVLQKGYRLGDRLLRPSMVKVATRA